MNSQLISIYTEDDELFQFQGITTYTGNDTSAITSYPTSEGTPRTDNIYNNPNTFTCSISIGGNENIDDEWGIGSHRPKTAEAILRKWKEDAIELTIQTPQKDYFNMFLTGISPQTNQQNPYDLVVGLTFTELRIASFSTDTIEVADTSEELAENSSDDNSGNGWSVAKNIISSVLVVAGAVGGSLLGGVPLGTAVGAYLGALSSQNIDRVCNLIGGNDE